MLLVSLLLLAADGGVVDLRKLEGTHVELGGVAQNAKGGAVLLINGMPIYVHGQSAWQRSAVGKTVTVKGTLKKMKLIPSPTRGPDGAISAGAEGDQWVLVDPTF